VKKLALFGTGSGSNAENIYNYFKASSDVSVVLDEFKRQFNKSWIKKKFSIDTTDLTSDALLESFFNESIPHINESDALTRLLIQ